MNPLETVEIFGAAWANHDLDEALRLVTDDCIFNATGPAPDGTRCVGEDAIRTAWQPIFEDAASRIVVEETFAAGDRVDPTVALRMGRRPRSRGGRLPRPRRTHRGEVLLRQGLIS